MKRSIGSTLLFWALCLGLGTAGLSYSQAEEPPPLPSGLEEAQPAPVSEPALPQGLSPGGTEAAGEPALPGGLEEGGEPQLPSGIAGEEEPQLPGGLEGTPSTAETARQAGPSRMKRFRRSLDSLGFAGFWEARGGIRTQNDPYEKDASIGETRLQLELEPRFKGATFNVTADFLYDPVLDDYTVDLDSGTGWVDLREANVSFSPLSFMDLKLGRQILTWGTGDFLFINDMFPKDWPSFFIGRDDEYLKAPSDCLKMSLFSRFANLDVVFSPKFDPDRYISGARISYFNPMLGRPAGRDAVIQTELPDTWFEDVEWAARLAKNVGGYEFAVYGYYGFWKSPGGMNPATGKAVFPDLSVYGGSARGPLWKGIANVEVGYYDSRNDRSGTDPFTNNSEFRAMVGYEMDLPQIAHDFTVGFQYYLEWMQDYNAYLRSLPPGSRKRDELRHLLTARLTKLLMSQNLTLSLFTFYSPSDSDAYLRPEASYKITDHWTGEVGGNWFLGSSDESFFGQFQKDTNIYAGIRYGF